MSKKYDLKQVGHIYKPEPDLWTDISKFWSKRIQENTDSIHVRRNPY